MEIYKRRLYLIDGSSYIYRAFFAIREYLSNSKGLPTNAIYGFAIMLLKILKEEGPDYLSIVFDAKGKTFREEEYAEYKAHRPSMPEDLIPQIPYIYDLVKAFNIPILQIEGYEADDIIGTMAKRGEREGYQVTIVSGDKDLMQLISPNVKMLDTLKNRLYGEEEVIERFGVGPERVVEVMALVGDTSDNIPGVPGIGPKTATTLIKRFGDIETLFDNVEKIDNAKLKERLLRHKDQAQLSRRLSTLVTDIDIDIDMDELKRREMVQDRVIRLFKELEFVSLFKDLTPKEDVSDKDYKIILRREDFEGLIERLKMTKGFSIDLETTHKEPVMATIVGISISFKEDEAFYIPIRHNYQGIPEQLNSEYLLSMLKPILENEKIEKYGQNIKYEIIVLSLTGIHLKGITFDTMVASYLINPSKHNHNLEDIALEYLNYRMTSYSEVVGKGAKEISFQEVDIQDAANYSCNDADITFKLTNILSPLIERDGVARLYHEVELPLIDVLAEIEINGVKIDKDFMEEMSKHLDREINQYVSRIYAGAGEEFNIKSPKQLATILFDKLKLRPIKRTKTGYSTDVKVLEELAIQNENGLPADILACRQLMKLKSTYVDPLPTMINPSTGRIHASFNQTVTATGRLSSSNPNLQNIPIRTEIGREIRKGFIAESGSIIVSSDYSQIELRILAHLSGDETLIKAFRDGEDIHTRTAVDIFGVFPEMITPDMRRIAKAVNFGIIYGMSPYGLSRDLKVSQKMAKEFIERYFSLYKRVKEYIDRTIKEAYENGYVTTLLRRKRYLPDMESKNRQIKEFAERTAINTTIQGSAADIIKMAMINISRRMKRETFGGRGLRSKMILQVHDELVFEVPIDEKETMIELIREEMEGVMELSVPITVDIHWGRDWNEAY
ncbi:MAG: DNA polymerase I [Nitrospinae bacterium]|nr:DNA polymerase I [Nitrospinota bacterium]